MKTFKVLGIFAIAAISSLSISKQITGQSDKEDFKVTRYSSAQNPAKVVVEHSLVSQMKPIGKIEGAFRPTEKLANEETVYLKFNEGNVSVGDRFLIYSNLGGVRVPGSFFKYVGNNILYKGSVQVTSVLPNAIVGKISEASLDIEVGDLLTPYRDLSMKIEPKEPTVEVRGKVLGSPNGTELIGAFNFAYIDKGAKDGLQMNDRLSVYMTSDGNKDVTHGMPEVNIAHLVVVNLDESFSTAYVLSATDRVERGNSFKTDISLVKFLDDKAPTPAVQTETERRN